jgi:hypothetical protein
MTPTQRAFAIVVSILFFLFVMNAIRRRAVEIQYAILWLAVAAGIFVLSVWYDLLLALSRFIGAVVPTTTLFLFGILFLVIINIQFSMRVSNLQTRLRALAQEHALLVERVERERHDAAPSAS